MSKLKLNGFRFPFPWQEGRIDAQLSFPTVQMKLRSCRFSKVSKGKSFASIQAQSVSGHMFN